MPIRAVLAVLLSTGLASQAAAQDAAETAIILSGSGQAQGKAQRSLGSAVAGSIGNAASGVRTRASAPLASRSRPRSAGRMIVLPGDVDPLEATDAPTYRLANGASIRVSGGLRSPGEACRSDCPER